MLIVSCYHVWPIYRKSSVLNLIYFAQDVHLLQHKRHCNDGINNLPGKRTNFKPTPFVEWICLTQYQC